MFHRFDPSEIDGVGLPLRFTNPFDYKPHATVRMAADQLQVYLRERSEWSEEISRGKMFGVLVVRNGDGEVGFLAAFSGNLSGATRHEYFTPPIFDLQQVGSFFGAEEAEISEINSTIAEIESSQEYHDLIDRRVKIAASHDSTIEEFRAKIKSDKSRRKTLRDGGCSTEELAMLVRESQYQKAQLKRLEQSRKEDLSEVDALIEPLRSNISTLKDQRRRLSVALQRKIFDHYQVRNHRGEFLCMTDIFENSIGALPPAGAGECAAPKLLQFAFDNNLEIIALGEFWQGESPRGEIRHHGYYYPACQSKCRYILGYMLDGMELENWSSAPVVGREIEVLYQDEYLAAVNKPSGMLSVMGRDKMEVSVESKLSELFPQYPEAKVVHRLDMDTSGILLIALNGLIYSALQAQFAAREVKKRYVALLDGEISNNVGELDLPLIADIEERPRQKVDYQIGKESHTTYDIVERRDGVTRVNLYPHTGRTHQLRVHCSHCDGLNTPIVGDRLYGTSAERLMLHAAEITFTHPVTGERVNFSCEPEF